MIHTYIIRILHIYIYHTHILHISYIYTYIIHLVYIYIYLEMPNPSKFKSSSWFTVLSFKSMGNDCAKPETTETPII